jgi:hypothetical protein
MVPADRYFGVESEVRKAIQAQVARNAIRLALGERPRKPVFLVGQVDGQTVSVHGEEGRVVVQTPDGAVKEIETRDLGIEPRKEASDGEGHGEGERSDDGEGSGTGAAGPGGGGGGAAEAGGAQAHDVPDAAPGAGAGAGAVAGGERGGAGAGAPDGDGGAQGVAGEDEP